MISDTRLFPLNKPNNPPMTSRMMYIQRTLLGFIIVCVCSWQRSGNETRKAQQKGASIRNHRTRSTPRFLAASPGLHFEAQDLARFAFGDDLEGTATDLAIRCKPLEGDARINDDFKSLSAIG